MYHDIWFIGDNFLYEMMPVLQTMNIEANAKKKPVPYVYEYFNVYGYYTNPLNQTRGVMACMFNAFAEALNASLHLPKFIFLIPDRLPKKYIV